MTEDRRRQAFLALGALLCSVVLLGLALASDSQWAVVGALVVVTPVVIVVVLRWIGRS